MNEVEKMNDELDDELALLFSAFDDVHATEKLKSQTLSRVFNSPEFSEALEEADAAETCGVADTVDDNTSAKSGRSAEVCPSEESGPSREAGFSAELESSLNGNLSVEKVGSVEGGTPSAAEADCSASNDEAFTTALGGRLTAQTEKPAASRVRASRGRVRFRAIRAAAVAACLVLALVGGVAYAVPTSTVQLSQGDATIELGVNRFGFVVSASSSDDSGRAIVEKGGLLASSYDDALKRIADAFGQPSSDKPFEAMVDSRDAWQRERIEGKNREFMEERNGGWNPGSVPDGGGSQEAIDGWQPEDRQSPAGVPAADRRAADGSGAGGQMGEPNDGRSGDRRKDDGSVDQPSEPSVDGEAGVGQPNASQTNDQASPDQTGAAQPDEDRGNGNNKLDSNWAMAPQSSEKRNDDEASEAAERDGGQPANDLMREEQPEDGQTEEGATQFNDEPQSTQESRGQQPEGGQSAVEQHAGPRNESDNGAGAPPSR